MKIEQVKAIINKLEEIHKEDEWTTQALKTLVSLLCEEEHITYNRKMYDILDILKIIDYELYDILHYYYTECVNMKDWWMVMVKGAKIFWTVEYKLSNKEDLIRYIEDCNIF